MPNYRRTNDSDSSSCSNSSSSEEDDESSDDDRSYGSDTGVLGAIGKAPKTSLKTSQRTMTTNIKVQDRSVMRIRRNRSNSSYSSSSESSSEAEDVVGETDDIASTMEKLNLNDSCVGGPSEISFGNLFTNVNVKQSLVPPKIRTHTKLRRLENVVARESEETSTKYSTDSDFVRLSVSSGQSVLMNLPSGKGLREDEGSTSSGSTVVPTERNVIDGKQDLDTPVSTAATEVVYQVIGASPKDSLLIDSPQINQSKLSNKRADQSHRISRTRSTVPITVSKVISEKQRATRTPLQRERVRKGKWSLGERIGLGSFGEVHVGMNKRTGSLIAVKSVTILTTECRDIDDFQREIDLMQVLVHPNIVQYLGAETDEEKGLLYIFQEWVPGGSIASLIDKFGKLSPNVVQTYMLQTLHGLLYLHSNNIVHRDIKGGNILVDGMGAVKLADFGASKYIGNGSMAASLRGTPYFMAPEVFEKQYDGKKADIWSVGGVALQMITGNPPWKSLKLGNPMALFLHIRETCDPPPMSHNDVPLILRQLIEKCFLRDPDKRPTAGQLISDDFFTKKLENEDDDGDDENSRSDLSHSDAPRTPRVDVRSASKRAIMMSEERRRGDRALFSHQRKQNDQAILGFRTDGVAQPYYFRNKDRIDVENSEKNIQNTISPLSCSDDKFVAEKGDEYPSWVVKAMRDEDEAAKENTDDYPSWVTKAMNEEKKRVEDIDELPSRALSAPPLQESSHFKENSIEDEDGYNKLILPPISPESIERAKHSLKNDWKSPSKENTSRVVLPPLVQKFQTEPYADEDTLPVQYIDNINTPVASNSKSNSRTKNHFVTVRRRK